MREILFRGKRLDNNEWVYGGIVHQTDYYGKMCDRYFVIDGTDTQDYNIGYKYEVVPETVGEYTGLLDENDVKIFEGDIVKLDDEEYSVNIGIVGFEEGLFIIAELNGDEDKFVVRPYCEVIGNIYNNPELIPSKED